MKNIRVAWINEDEEYSARVRNYAKKHYSDVLEMMVYSEMPSDLELDDVMVIVVTPERFNDKMAENGGTLLILHEGSIPEKLLEMGRIYKYTPADEILDQILWSVESSAGNGEIRVGREKTRVIGVGGDISISEGVVAAMAIADILSESKKVLLLNMSQCGTGYLRSREMEAVEPECNQYDVSRLLYAIASQKSYGQIEAVLDSCIRRDKEYDYVMSASNPEHFMEEIGGLVTNTIEFTVKTGRYAYVIYVTNYIPGRMSELLKNTDRYIAMREVYAPVCDGEDFISYIQRKDESGDRVRVLEYDRAHIREQLRVLLADYIRGD